MKRFILVLALVATAGTLVVGQRLSIDTTYIRSGASIGGAVLYAPSYTTDQFFYFPPTGGMLLTTSNYGGWSLSGNALGGTEVLGSINGFDVHLIAGGSSNIRLSLLNNAPAVLLPARTELRFGDVAGGDYSALKAPQIQTGNVTYVLPYYKPTEAGQRLQVDTLNGDTVVLGYTTEEKSTDVSFDTKTNFTETNAGPIDVADMAITVLPNKTYAFEAVISVQYTGAGCDAEISFTLPIGASLHYYRVNLTLNNAQAAGNKTEAVEVYAAPAAPAETHYILKGFVRTNGNGGVVQMRLATTNPGNTIRLTENSYMQITTN
jgi:hypothetical protein